jgi:hypothetical protein
MSGSPAISMSVGIQSLWLINSQVVVQAGRALRVLGLSIEHFIAEARSPIAVLSCDRRPFRRAKQRNIHREQRNAAGLDVAECYAKDVPAPAAEPSDYEIKRYFFGAWWLRREC